MAEKSYAKLTSEDAMMLADVISTFKDKRSSSTRTRMILFCFSHVMSRGKPCPYFSCGIRTIAKECGVSEGTARRFIEAMERDGVLVKVGDGKRGRYQKRAFWWMAGAKCAQVCTHPMSQIPPVSTHQCVQTPCDKYTHQSTEYSESASALTASAEAHAHEWSESPEPEFDFSEFEDSGAE